MSEGNRSGLVPKHVFDLTQKDTTNKNIKYSKMGRLAMYKSVHGFILAATTIAQSVAEESSRTQIQPEDLIEAMDRLGMSSISGELLHELQKNPPIETPKVKTSPNKNKKPSSKAASRTASKRKKGT